MEQQNSRRRICLTTLSIVVAASAIGCLKTAPIQAPPSIRVENRSAMDLKNVSVNGISFGDIRRGERTKYQTIKGAYRYGHVYALTPTGPLEIFPIDYVGESPLGAGNYTYALTVSGGRLITECETN
jgi:hypothetical protein